MQSNLANTAVYVRLSKEDKAFSKNNSDSIESQILLLEQYAKENNFLIYDYYKDDGVSGTTFQRQSFLRLLEDIDAGHIKTVLVKDLSRLGRDYIESGRYQEIVFPEKGVRLISVVDNYDSENEESNDIVPFKNLFNDFYPRDISKKTRSALRARAQNGEYLGAGVYGYLKDPLNKHHLIPDPETAPVVRKIFALCISGYSFSKIARLLASEKIPNPAGSKGFLPKREYYINTDWHYSSVRKILSNQVYAGDMVYGKRRKLNYKSDKIISEPEEKWIVVKGTHEPLIDKKQWDLAQEIASKRTKATKSGEPHMFAGLLKCSTCGAPLAKDSGGAYTCQIYKKMGKGRCTSHRIRESDLESVVLASIQNISNEIKNNKEHFIKLISDKGREKQNELVKFAKKEKSKTEKRILEINTLLKTAFEKNVLGNLDDEIYTTLTNDYRVEKKSLESRLTELNLQIDVLNQENSKLDSFIALVEKYLDLKEIDREIAHQLIEKIVVYHTSREEGTKYQRIDIHYRFVGQI